jgi:hypothetical protein
VVRALRPSVVVASVLLRFVLLFQSPNQARRTSVQWRRVAADHDFRAIPSLSPAASAVDHRLPDGNAPQAKRVLGLMGTT